MVCLSVCRSTRRKLNWRSLNEQNHVEIQFRLEKKEAGIQFSLKNKTGLTLSENLKNIFKTYLTLILVGPVITQFDPTKPKTHEQL